MLSPSVRKLSESYSTFGLSNIRHTMFYYRRVENAMLLMPGDRVRLLVPENPNLHRAEATVDQVTEWGAHVSTRAAATGRFRALYSEMEFCDGKGVLSKQEVVEASISGTTLDSEFLPGSTDTPYGLTIDFSVQVGYTGDVCDICGSCRLRRSGSCAVCEECGATSSCG